MRKLFRYIDNDFNLGHTLDTAPNSDAFRMHTHSETELFYFVRGRGTFHIEGTAYPLESGDLLVMAPSEAHYIDIDYSQSYERKVLQFNTAFFHQIDPQGILCKAILDREPGKQNLYRGQDFGIYWDRMMCSKGDPRTNLIAGLLPLLNELYQLHSAGKEPQITAADTLEQHIIRYINEHLDQAIRLDDICQRFFISKSQLFRLFKRATGSTIYQYLTVKRLMLARQLLLDGASPTHIYTQCGFSDYSTFYRAYVKHFGHSPKSEQSVPNI